MPLSAERTRGNSEAEVVAQDLHRHRDRRFGPFASLERVLTALVLQGADRQSMHERLREHSLEAWRAVEAGEPNPLPDLLVKDTSLLHYLQPGRLRELLDASGYTGLAPRWALEFAQRIRARLEPQGSRSEE